MLKKNLINALIVTVCFLLLTATATLAREEHLPTSKGQTVYVPAYSHIYHGNRESSPLLLTVTVSIRNISPTHNLTISTVDYYASQGEILKKYITAPLVLRPLNSQRFIVAQNDDSGGSGANFIVKWQSAEPISPPIIETIMIGSQNQLGISFTSRGQEIYK